MPEKNRAAVRILTSHGERQGVPPSFWKSAAGPAVPQSERPGEDPVPGSGSRGGVSTARTLIEAAQRAGTLDQLAEEARAAAALQTDKKVENAETLHLLVELARGKGATVVPYIERRAAEIVRKNNQPQSQENGPGGKNAGVRRGGSGAARLFRD